MWRTAPYLPDESVGRKTGLVFHANGMEAIALIGAVYQLEECKLFTTCQQFCGSGTGSIVAVLLALQYTLKDLVTLLERPPFDCSAIRAEPFRNIKELHPPDHKKEPLYADTEPLFRILQQIVTAKYQIPWQDFTFDMLYKLTNNTLVINATCLTEGKMCLFSHVTHPEMNVLDAVRVAMASPPYFAPVEYKGHVYIDGSWSAGIPVGIFDYPLETNDVVDEYLALRKSPHSDTIVFCTVPEYTCAQSIRLGSPPAILHSALVCRFQNLSDVHSTRFIQVRVSGCLPHTMDYALVELMAMMESGRRATREYLLAQNRIVDSLEEEPARIMDIIKMMASLLEHIMKISCPSPPPPPPPPPSLVDNGKYSTDQSAQEDGFEVLFANHTREAEETSTATAATTDSSAALAVANRITSYCTLL